jgi:activator of HSP90 ATPase
MKKRSLHQKIKVEADPHEIFEVFMDSEKHSKLTESYAKISREVGGKFTSFDDWASGENVELVKDKKIVQTWRGDDWPEGHYSTITFLIEKEGKDTIIDFTQTDIPDDLYEDIKQGWIDFYWEKLKDYFNK